MEQTNSCNSSIQGNGFSRPLVKAIEAGDVSAVRAAIITHADSDYFAGTASALSIADKASEYLKAKGLSLFEPDNGSVSLIPNAWDEEAWNMGKAALRLNFSREKIEYVTKLIGLYHASKTGSRGVSVNATATEYSSSHAGIGSSLSSACPVPLPLAIAIGVIIGGGVGAAIGASVKATFAGAVVGGAVAGAVSVIAMK